MCLVALALDRSRRFPLVVASNRDEYFARPAARLAWWTPEQGGPAILGGRDLESGGTWMGLTARGRLAMLTNVRSGERFDPAAPSRGKIVTDWLAAREATGAFWMRTSLSGHNGFNLIAADFARGECFSGSGSGAPPQALARGLYGLSNGALDAPWPKVVSLKASLAAAIASAGSADALAAGLFAALGDLSIAPDSALPCTGVPLDWERQLSPAFILTPDRAYGTRCSTLLISEKVGRNLLTHVFERSFTAGGSVSPLRHALLRHWPPRRTDGADTKTAEAGEVSETDHPAPADAAQRKRSRRAAVTAAVA